MSGKILIIILFVVGTSIIFSSCSSSRKMKKKCLDCPEFSQYIKLNNQFAQLNERI